MDLLKNNFGVGTDIETVSGFQDLGREVELQHPSMWQMQSFF